MVQVKITKRQGAAAKRAWRRARPAAGLRQRGRQRPVEHVVGELDSMAAFAIEMLRQAAKVEDQEQAAGIRLRAGRVLAQETAGRAVLRQHGSDAAKALLAGFASKAMK